MLTESGCISFSIQMQALFRQSAFCAAQLGQALEHTHLKHTRNTNHRYLSFNPLKYASARPRVDSLLMYHENFAAAPSAPASINGTSSNIAEGRRTGGRVYSNHQQQLQQQQQQTVRGRIIQINQHRLTVLAAGQVCRCDRIARTVSLNQILDFHILQCTPGQPVMLSLVKQPKPTRFSSMFGQLNLSPKAGKETELLEMLNALSRKPSAKPSKPS